MPSRSQSLVIILMIVAGVGLLVFQFRSRSLSEEFHSAETGSILIPVDQSEATTLIQGMTETDGNLQNPASFSGQENGETHVQDAAVFSPEDLNSLQIK